MFNYKKHMQYKDYIEELPSKLLFIINLILNIM